MDENDWLHVEGCNDLCDPPEHHYLTGEGACDRLPCWHLRGHEGPCDPGSLVDPRRVNPPEGSLS